MSLPGAAGQAGQPTPRQVEQTNVPGQRGEQANVHGHIGGAIWCTGAEVSGALGMHCVYLWCGDVW